MLTNSNCCLGNSEPNSLYCFNNSRSGINSWCSEVNSGSSMLSTSAVAAISISSIFLRVISPLYIIWIGNLLFKARSSLIKRIRSLACLVVAEITIPLPLDLRNMKSIIFWPLRSDTYSILPCVSTTGQSCVTLPPSCAGSPVCLKIGNFPVKNGNNFFVNWSYISCKFSSLFSCSPRKHLPYILNVVITSAISCKISFDTLTLFLYSFNICNSFSRLSINSSRLFLVIFAKSSLNLEIRSLTNDFILSDDLSNRYSGLL